MEILETEDVFKGASLLCMGATLEEVKCRHYTVTFTLKGEELNHVHMNYMSGKTQVNPLQLKETLNMLKDMIFQNKRNRERKRERSWHSSRKMNYNN